ncbi:NACHT C-terminal helical domain 2-containing protein [Anabaena cylindrica]|uniref:NACHT C-terminal helical domain 2-containing protein n=1 Tax=Anabaena cylindrica TaxID=1165 RepID=UPI0003005E4F|nr:hypothetical protein [Anabaena cylindrica]
MVTNFLLIGEIIDYEDLLVLMKEEADAIIISNNELQSFLSLLNKKSILIKIPYIKKSAIRAFYLDCLFLTNKNSLDGGISLSISPNSEREMERIIKFNHGFKYIYERINDLNSEIIYNYLDNKSVINYLENTRFNHFAICINDALIYSIQNAYNDEMKKDLQYIKELLPQNQPYPYMNEKIIQFKYWWKDNRLTFFNKIELVVKKHGDIDDFKFNDNQERNLLKSYYDANKLLILTYLNSGCIVSDSVRQEIEETLLLPIAEIEKRKREIAE